MCAYIFMRRCLYVCIVGICSCMVIVRVSKQVLCTVVCACAYVHTCCAYVIVYILCISYLRLHVFVLCTSVHCVDVSIRVCIVHVYVFLHTRERWKVFSSIYLPKSELVNEILCVFEYVRTCVCLCSCMYMCVRALVRVFTPHRWLLFYSYTSIIWWSVCGNVFDLNRENWHTKYLPGE